MLWTVNTHLLVWNYLSHLQTMISWRRKPLPEMDYVLCLMSYLRERVICVARYHAASVAHPEDYKMGCIFMGAYSCIFECCWGKIQTRFFLSPCFWWHSQILENFPGLWRIHQRSKWNSPWYRICSSKYTEENGKYTSTDVAICQQRMNSSRNATNAPEFWNVTRWLW